MIMGEFANDGRNDWLETNQVTPNPKPDLTEARREIRDKYPDNLLPSYNDLQSNIWKPITIELNNGEIRTWVLSSAWGNRYFPVLFLVWQPFWTKLWEIKKILLSEVTTESPKDKFLRLMWPNSIVGDSDINPKELYSTYMYLALSNLTQGGSFNKLKNTLIYSEVLVNLEQSWLQKVDPSIIRQIRDGIIITYKLKDQSEWEFENYLKQSWYNTWDNEIDRLLKAYKGLNLAIEKWSGLERRNT